MTTRGADPTPRPFAGRIVQTCVARRPRAMGRALCCCKKGTFTYRRQTLFSALCKPGPLRSRNHTGLQNVG
jgi:hypothetical protein